MTEQDKPERAAHARVRFRRHDLPALDHLPSAATGVSMARPRRSAVRRSLRVASFAMVSLSLVAMLAIGALWIAINAGFGRERIILETERTLARIYGFPVKASLGGTTLSFDGGRYIAVEVKDVDIRRSDSGTPLTAASAIRLGIRPLPLLSGDIRIGSVRIDNAHAGKELATGGDGDMLAVIKDANGLTDPDRIAAAIFDAASAVFARLDEAGTKRIALNSTKLHIAGTAHDISRLVMTRANPGVMDIDLVSSSDGKDYTLKASAKRSRDGAITALDGIFTLSSFQLKGGEITGVELGPVTVALNGSETARGAGQRLTAKVTVEDYVAAIEHPAELSGNLTVTAGLQQGSGKVEFSTGLLQVNNSRFPFSGALGPDPTSESQGHSPRYRFELVTNDSRLSPMDTAEPAITLGARLAGQIIPSAATLNLSDLVVRTSGGEVVGTLRLVFGDSAPAIFLAIRSKDIPVAHAKQLWPWLSAPKARQWVVRNLFDGTLASASLELASGPGRLTDGIAFNSEEIHGEFIVKGTRFDIAGELPPVRDADGRVTFAGNDVDITLEKGTAWLQSGRTVATTGGQMLIKDAHLDTVIGKLDLDVAGDAAAIVELASRKPIDAGEKLGIGPEKFTGTAKGKVLAAIPLEDDVRVADIDWSVALEASNLSIDEDFDGQKLTSADASISIDPKAAHITAKGKLNGVDARIAIVEPLEAGAVKASQDVTLELSSKALATMAPGLDGILSGPVPVKMVSANGSRSIEADLAKATLSVPWIGWTKGAGIPATARFVLDSKGRNATIRDLRIDGKTFSVAGSISLVDDSVSSVEMSKVRLNRDDDFAMSMTRGSGGAMTISLRGAAMDARALIRQFSADRDEVLAKADRRPLKISAKLDRVIGFDGEVLSNVRMDYQGTGDTPTAANMTGVTGKGSAVRLSMTGGANRSMEMNTGDAGSLLRFMDIYGRMRGGDLKVAMFGAGKGPLKGQIDVTDFMLVDEPRLASLVAKPAPQSDGQSLSTAVKKDIDVSKVKFERGFVMVEKGEKYLSMERGVLRGPLIGTTFQGKLYDERGRMAVTGTFMPAYGLNRIFGEIPILGFVLGNGRDRGLIGITYKLAGDAKSPDLQINPISVIAPGIFRSIFEFR